MQLQFSAGDHINKKIVILFQSQGSFIYNSIELLINMADQKTYKSRILINLMLIKILVLKCQKLGFKFLKNKSIM